MADNNKISIARSDGKKHDLNAFVSMASNYKEIVKEPAKKPPTIAEEDHDHEARPITIKRSDGLSHDIIKVFKAFSDPRGDSLRLKQQSSQDGARRTNLNKLDMQNILSSSGRLPLPPPQNSYHPTSVRIVHMSDTHNFLNRNSSNFNQSFLPTGDILIHSGNFTNHGDDAEYEQFDNWLASVSDIYHYRVVVVGNRDVMIHGNDWDYIRRLLPHATHVLCHSEATILGVRIYGCPWHWGHEANYALKQGAPECLRVQDIPEHLDVLVTHGPAFGRLDTVIMGDIINPKTGKGHSLLKEEHWGSKELADMIIKQRPGLHLHGHVRGARGMVPNFGHAPLTVNSTLCDREAKVMYACPHVIRGTLLYGRQRSTDNNGSGGGGGGGVGGAGNSNNSGGSGNNNNNNNNDSKSSGKDQIWEFSIDALVV